MNSLMKNIKINQLKAGAILTYVSMGVGFLINLFYTPIMIRVLGQSEYGLYNLASSVIAYLGVLNFGLGSTYIRYYSKYKAKEDNKGIAKLNGMFLIIFSVIACIALFSGVILSLNSGFIFGDKLTPSELETASILLIILTLNLAFSFPSIVFTSYIRANERFVFQKLISLIRTVTSPFLVLPVLYLGYGSIGMAIIITSLNLLADIIYMIYSLRRLSMEISFREFDIKLMKEMTVFSSFIFINMVIDQINWNVDKYILGRVRGTISVAIYSLASHFNTFYLQLSTAISSVFVPRVHYLVASENSNFKITQLFTKIGRIQFILLSLILSGFILFGKPFILWWAGSNYSQSYYIIIILISTVTIPIIQNIGIEIQRAKDMHKFRALTYFIIAIINICLTIPLVKRHDGIGAALGTSFAILVGNGIIMNIYYHKKVKINVIYFWKSIFKFIPALLIPIIIGCIYVYYINIFQINFFILGIVIYSIVYVISMWVLGLNNFEKDLIKKTIRIFLNYIRK